MENDKNESQSLNLEKQSEDTAKSKNESDSNVKEIDLKDESGKGIFHVTTRYKWIFGLSVIILVVTAILIYAKYERVLGAEYWQMAVWGVCGILSIYSIFSKSLSALFLNLLLFFGISLIPAWILVYKFFKPILELITGTKLPEVPYYYTLP